MRQPHAGREHNVGVARAPVTSGWVLRSVSATVLLAFLASVTGIGAASTYAVTG